MPALAFPAYLTGQRFSACVVQACTVSDLGVVTLINTTGYAGDLAATGVMDEFEVSRTRRSVQLQPINAIADNFVPLASGFTASINEIRNGAGGSFLARIAANFFYVQVIVQVTPPGGAASWTEAVVGLIESTTNAYVAERNITTMNIVPIGIPHYAGVASTDPYGF